MSGTRLIDAAAVAEARQSEGPGRVLIIAFHYPPCFGRSGVPHALKFSGYLSEHGSNAYHIIAARGRDVRRRGAGHRRPSLA